MEQLVSNYHSVLSTSFICERSPVPTFPLNRVRFISSRKHRASSSLRMAQPGSNHDAQNPGEQTHQLNSFFFFFFNFIFWFFSCALKRIPMKLSYTHFQMIANVGDSDKKKKKMDEINEHPFGCVSVACWFLLIESEVDLLRRVQVLLFFLQRWCAVWLVRTQRGRKWNTVLNDVL